MGNAALGAAAVLGAVATFGSFGVPIKSRQLQDAQVLGDCRMQSALFSLKLLSWAAPTGN